MKPFWWEKLSPQDTMKTFGNWRRARLAEMIKKWCTEKFIFHVIIPALYPFWWKFYWLSQSTFIFSMLESRSRKNKIGTKMWRLKLLTITIASFNFFNCPVKSLTNLKLKFRSKVNHGFTNHGCLHSAVWKALYNLKYKEPRRQHITIFFQNV